MRDEEGGKGIPRSSRKQVTFGLLDRKRVGKSASARQYVCLHVDWKCSRSITTSRETYRKESKVCLDVVVEFR